MYDERHMRCPDSPCGAEEANKAGRLSENTAIRSDSMTGRVSSRSALA